MDQEKETEKALRRCSVRKNKKTIAKTVEGLRQPLITSFLLVLLIVTNHRINVLRDHVFNETQAILEQSEINLELVAENNELAKNSLKLAAVSNELAKINLELVTKNTVQTEKYIEQVKQLIALIQEHYFLP